MGEGVDENVGVEDALRSAERTRFGFILHLDNGSRRVYVRRKDRREVERALRGAGVVIVDEWGAQIDQSQLAVDPV